MVPASSLYQSMQEKLPVAGSLYDMKPIILHFLHHLC